MRISFFQQSGISFLPLLRISQLWMKEHARSLSQLKAFKSPFSRSLDRLDSSWQCQESSFNQRQMTRRFGFSRRANPVRGSIKLFGERESYLFQKVLSLELIDWN